MSKSLRVIHCGTGLAGAMGLRAIIEQDGLELAGLLVEVVDHREDLRINIGFSDGALHAVFEAVASKCRERGIEIAGSELIGMIPAAALEASRGHNLHWLNLRPELVIENRLKGLR